MATAKSVINIHPKVLAAAATGIGLSVVATFADKFDPSLFAGLGIYAAPAAMAATAIVSGFAGWLKSEAASEDTADQAVTQKAEAATDAALDVLTFAPPADGSQTAASEPADAAPATSVPITPTTSEVVGA